MVVVRLTRHLVTMREVAQSLERHEVISVEVENDPIRVNGTPTLDLLLPLMRRFLSGSPFSVTSKLDN